MSFPCENANEAPALFSRQESLGLKVPKRAAVVGLGGIGSWVALNLALVGTETLYLFDFDTVDQSNLNRTPFRLSQIGMPKSAAVAALILERRRGRIQVFPFFVAVTDLPEQIRKKIQVDVLFDCRDRKREPIPIQTERTVCVGYDATSLTIEEEPDYSALWAEGPSGYETVPSYFAPAQIAASLAVHLVLTRPPRRRLLTLKVDGLLCASG